MSTTANLAVPKLDRNPAVGSDEFNASIDALDLALTDVLDVIVNGSTNAGAIVLGDQQRHIIYRLIADPLTPPTAPATITLPAVSRGLFDVVNELAFDATIEIAGQLATPPIVDAGTERALASDGANIFDALDAGFWPLVASIVGSPSAGQVIYADVLSEDLTFFANFGFSAGSCDTPATSTAVFDVRQNGSSIGSVTFAAGAHAATLSTTSTICLPGDIIEVVAPAIPDATLAGIWITLIGQRKT